MKLMNFKRLSSVFALSLAGSLALAGCGGDGESNNKTDSGIPDSGVVADTGVETDGGTTADTGMPADSGAPPAPCPEGTEGCACESMLGPDDVAFLQDNCEADMLCVPWDAISQRTDLTGPVQSCVRPCSTDADCGSGQTCAPSIFGEETGAASICMDRIADYDEYCGFSRGLTSRVPDVSLETSGEIVGCAEGYTCTVGTFSDSHPDEGICLQFCEEGDTCPTETPYCNPALFSRTSSTGETIPVGACSVGRFDQGSTCGSTDTAKVGIASRCDSSDAAIPNLACFGTPDVPDGLGVCIALCNDGAEACAATDGSGLDQSCIAIPEIFDPATSDFTGICGSACEDNFPDICAGDGTQGLGQYCSGPFQFSQDGNGFAFCADRNGPAYAPAQFDGMGMAVNLGDSCTDDSTRCPEPSFCLDPGDGNAICVVGCVETSSTTPNAELCSTLLGSSTATCATGLFQAPELGVCGDSAN